MHCLERFALTESSERTTWHPPFTRAISERGPRWICVRGEVQLTQEPLRADDVCELRVDVPRDPNDCGRTLRGLWPLIVVVALLELKTISRPFRRGDLARLIAYGFVWFYTHQHADALTLPDGPTRRAVPNDLTLALVVPTITPTLEAEITQLGLTLTHDANGYHRVTGTFCLLIVVELARVADAERDELMGWFAGTQHRPSVDLARWIMQNTSMSSLDNPADLKASPDLEGFSDWIAALQQMLSPEERLKGLTPEERLDGLTPEEVLPLFRPEEVSRALTEADHILALPDAALHALAPEYLSTLPDDVQARVRTRLGR